MSFYNPETEDAERWCSPAAGSESDVGADAGSSQWRVVRPDFVQVIALVRSTSFRGIWGNCLGALREARRVVRSGGKVGVSFWGNQRRMETYPLFAVLGQTSPAERNNTGTMVNIGRPGMAEQLMSEAGLIPGERTSLRLHWEFPDVDLAVRALAATGPAYLAIQHLGKEAFMASARQAAAGLYVGGIGVRAEVEVQCLVGVVPD